MTERNSREAKEYIESLYKAGELPMRDDDWHGEKFADKGQAFNEVKIKMVMKLRGLTRKAAIKAMSSGASSEGKGRA